MNYIKSPLKGFYSHFLNREVDISKSNSDFTRKGGEFYDTINTYTLNNPEDKRQNYIQ